MLKLIAVQEIPEREDAMGTVLQTRTKRKVSEGKFYPLGATLTTDGVNFAVYSQNAREVYLLPFDRPDGEPTDLIRLENQSRYIWYAHVRGLKAGQLYGYKIRGEYNPAYGLRFNENKLLVDPYAKALTGKFVNPDNLLLAYNPDEPTADLSRDERDNTRVVPKSIVVDDGFDWQGDVPLDYDLEKLYIYEVHLKGFTAHPSSRVEHPGTYQVGNFPIDWSEWNGKFRDTMRRFGKGDPGQVRDLGWRLTGSADLYGEDGRSPYNSVNFITCHDGFTLNDLVSYNEKHNEANAEENRDGTNDNLSWNCGAEGETDDAAIRKLRSQLIKNHICCLVFSSGTPMILGGDEIRRTQKGNNNAYCQDNEISWFDWTLAEKNGDILSFFRKAIAFTRRFPILQRRKFFRGVDLDADGVNDITWFGTNGGRPVVLLGR
jgi:pullulanase/glycogen debranching enzyme